MILTSARRVPWKGQEDVIRAAGLLARQGRFKDSVVTINGAGWANFEHHLLRLIAEENLAGKVFLLDQLSPDEVVTSYTGATVAVHPNREPKPIGYSNIEAMLPSG
ncbi:glycosyltransferase [Streptomyces xiamenensis]|uniref:glycosyltransferase n=1 Tax=Streptomyces xiamenensis TaxID=408015 RepID=UPI0036EF0DA0